MKEVAAEKKAERLAASQAEEEAHQNKIAGNSSTGSQNDQQVNGNGKRLRFVYSLRT